MEPKAIKPQESKHKFTKELAKLLKKYNADIFTEQNGGAYRGSSSIVIEVGGYNDPNFEKIDFGEGNHGILHFIENL